ncbi:MAG: T9SS type A sorting domain-containing protein [Cyclobacteriaceae bacterium]
MHKYIAIIPLLFFFPLSTILAQEEDSIRVKIMKETNGQMRVFEKAYASEEEMANDPEFKQFQEDAGDSSTFIFRTGQGNFSWNQDSDDSFVIIDKVQDGDENIVVKDQVIRLGSGNGNNFMFRSGDDEESEVTIINGDTVRTLKLHGPHNRVWVNRRGNPGAVRFRAGRSISLQEVTADDLAGSGKSTGRELKPKEIEFNIDGSEGTLYIQFLIDSGELSVEVFNKDRGQIFYDYRSDFDGRYAKTINLSGQEAGTYYLEIRQGSRTLFKKILVK